MSTQARLTLADALAQARAMKPGLPLEALYVGPDAARALADFARAKCGPRALVLSDENTCAIGGQPVFNALAAAGKSIAEKRYGADPVDANDFFANEVADALHGHDFIVAIGAGSLCDLAKQAATIEQKPALLFAAAASMNGYTSGITALKVKGLKRTIPCTPAAGVFADPEIVATAPIRMAAAGVADFLSKGSSSSDWRAAHLLRGETYDEQAMVFYRGVQERVLSAAPGVGRSEPGAVGEVLEALLLSGLSMLVAGSSSPASGGEHLISHYLDMKSGLYGTPHDLHGAQVGVGTLHCLKLWEQVLALDPAAIDVDALLQQHPSDEEIRTMIDEDWGITAPEVWQQWQQKALGPEGLRAELQAIKARLPELRDHVMQGFIPHDAVEEAIAASGGPVTPDALGAPVEEYDLAIERARYIRSRFTILDLAAELGIH